MRPKQILALLVAVGIPLFFFYVFEGRNGLPPRPHIQRLHSLANNDTTSNKIKVKDTLWFAAAPFSFIDQRGRTITQQNVSNKIRIAGFLSTNSPLSDQFGKNLIRLNTDFINDTALYLLLHTLDPQHDTQKTLHDYADRYETDSTRQFLLTGNQSAIYKQAINGYRITLASADTLNNLQGKLVLIDRQGVARGYYDGTKNEEFNRLMTDIRILYLDYPRPREKFEVRQKNKQ